ncbi:LysR substrate-binding domain-containing protein [Sphingomonas sp.]|uniref:LysR substrate-binding domain-containing protein n=1 Tax=Sphingomonas sp. TaxID=28214 RepID=UPI001ED39BB7|nr:LysR substrate-binding domain-containing protein [Sphingomonas sp.]MBX3595027.1 LysR family transcriptional regulator [Sphingomonas sp.]
MLDIRQMRYFIAVAEELSFSRAARRLGMSQPPLSQQIQAIETALGVRLLDRTTRSVRLTHAGSVLLDEARKLVDQAARSADRIDRVRRGELGQLRIGTLSSACFQILPTFLAQLKRDRPDIAIALRERDTAHALAELSERRLDLAFVRIEMVEAPLRIRPILSDRFILALPESHRLASHKTVSLASLAGEPLVMVAREVSPRFFDAIIAAFASQGVTPVAAHECGSLQSQVSFVSSGSCCALVPESNRHVRMPGVIYRPLTDPVRLDGIALAWLSPPENAVVAAAIDAADAVFGSNNI